MDDLTMITIGITAPLVALLVWTAVAYNRLVRQRNQVRASWAQVDVQLKRRHDLVPNLVAVVKAYAAHERGTLEAVVLARSQAMSTRGSAVAGRAEAESLLTQQLGSLLALSEDYPDLQASEAFAQLQRDLAVTEDKIAYARQFYNSAVQTLANTVHAIPTNLVAALAGFHPPPYFQAGERGPVQVQF